jgi:uncharacterized protein (UPF0548 family)
LTPDERTPPATAAQLTSFCHLSFRTVGMVIGLRSPSQGKLDELPTLLARQPVTYAQAGATGSSALPSGYRHDRRSTTVGVGNGAWAQARRGLVEWRAHEGAGMNVTAEDAPLVPGTVVIVTTRIGLLWVVAPCRIIYITDTADRFGFAYGTLPGHPEKGEEAFHVQRNGEGRVTFEIVAFSKPAELLARLGGPISRAIQQRATNRYLNSLRTFVAASALS